MRMAFVAKGKDGKESKAAGRAAPLLAPKAMASRRREQVRT